MKLTCALPSTSQFPRSLRYHHRPLKLLTHGSQRLANNPSLEHLRSGKQLASGAKLSVGPLITQSTLTQPQTMRATLSWHNLALHKLHTFTAHHPPRFGHANRSTTYDNIAAPLGTEQVKQLLADFKTPPRQAGLETKAPPRTQLQKQGPLCQRLKKPCDRSPVHGESLISPIQSKNNQRPFDPTASSEEKESPLKPIHNANPDVIILGAGIAGCGAANRLLANDMRVLLLEANDKPGGRLQSAKVGGLNVDLGAAWLHQGAKNPLTPIIEGLGYPTHPDQAKHLAMSLRDGKPVDETEAFFKMVNALEASWTHPTKGQRHAQPVAQTSQWTDGALGYLIPLQAGVDSYRLCMQDYLRIENEKADYQVDGGFAMAARGLMSELPIHLNTKASRINYDSNGATVTAWNQATETTTHWRAVRVICTVSTGVLNAGDISFEPPLPQDKTRLFSRLPMGYFEKIIMAFEPSLFNYLPSNTHLHCDRPSHEAVEFLTQSAEQPLVVALVGAGFAKKLMEAGKDQAIAFALDELTHYFGPSVKNHFKEGEISNWCHNPTTRGSYSAALPGHANERLRYLEPVGPIYFAGEAGHPSWGSCVPGAYLSGLEAAERILGELKPDIL